MLPSDGAQPMPTPGRVAVTPVARGLFLQMLLQRELKGIQTYGVSLQTDNGRDAVQDALEEAIDLWQYLVQISLERDALAAAHANCSNLSHAEASRIFEEARQMREERDAARRLGAYTAQRYVGLLERLVSIEAERDAAQQALAEFMGAAS